MRRLRLLVALFLATSPASAAIYHVAPPASGGNDGNPGTPASPWATLQHAADSVGPGDTVLVRAGDYQGMHLETSGTPGRRITFRSYPGELVRIVADNPVTIDGINLEGASHVTIRGFVVDGRTRAGIRAVLCEHVHIVGNRCDQNGTWGILTGFCDDLVITGNETSRSGDEHGIYVSNSGDRPRIAGNVIWGNFANGIHMNGDLSEGGDGIISGAIVESNTIFGNGAGGGSGINMDGVQGSIVRNNLIFDSHASGISLYQIDGGGPSSGNNVLNNTVLVASDGRWALNIRNGSTNNVVKNNVLFSEDSFRGAMNVSEGSVTGLTSDHNLVENRFSTDDGDSTMTLAQWQALGHDPNSTAIALPDAALENPGSGDFSPEGPALDAGETLVEVPSDLSGRPRPAGPAFDVGALEGADGIFADGFEGGSTVRWKGAPPFD